MVCHNIEQSLTYSDNIYIMDNRNVITSGFPEKIVRDEETLRKVFGVSLKSMDDDSLLYPYVFTK